MPARLAAGSKSPLSGPTYSRPVRISKRQRATGAADTWVDDGQVHADGHVGNRVREHEGALEHRQ